MVYRQTVIVRGQLPFPVDMLRYDGLAPADSDAVTAIESDPSGISDNLTVTVRLCRTVSSSRTTPTLARWRSFGWEVLDVVTMKEA